MGDRGFRRILLGLHQRFQQRFKDSWLLLDSADGERLKQMTFAMIGFGGVGTITVELLARLGVQRFRLLDLDRYEASNLGRQLFATNQTLGRFKAEVAAERILDINPDAQLEMVLCERISPDNAVRMVEGADMLIQTADTPSALLIYDIAREHKVPVVNGYCANYKCFVQAFDYRSDRCRSWIESLKDRIKWKNRKHIREMSADEMEALDSTQYSYEQVCPPLNFCTNAAGCLIVSEAVKLLLNRGCRACHPRRLHLDLFNLKLKVENTYSIFRLENYMRLFTLFKGRAHMAKIQKPEENRNKTKPGQLDEQSTEQATSSTS